MLYASVRDKPYPYFKIDTLVHEAIRAGFRGIDSAANPKLYDEPKVGFGVRKAIAEGLVTREDLFLQSKFMGMKHQDPNRVPYNPKLGLTDRVYQSIKSSLHDLRPGFPAKSSPLDSYIDMFILEAQPNDLNQTVQAWEMMETFWPLKIRHLGIANVNVDFLRSLCERVRVQPSLVQNRFGEGMKYDSAVRTFCASQQMVYQACDLHVHNSELLEWGVVRRLAEKAGISTSLALNGLVMGLEGVTVVNANYTAETLGEDVAFFQKMAQFTEKCPREWSTMKDEFGEMIGLLAQDSLWLPARA
ncbi:Aldo/keto reductase [Aspergillus ellipticus CBS 707.79]|uniref:Aldo/keto reductase n=1 Tax=Aspergillus ellipticus CBS 707.79 TaxID=1448320 RepID=A0A319CXS6_9EURO|nr:Aldo/keto reductase [Aspergillus ellipticus CBS 707.79]